MTEYNIIMNDQFITCMIMLLNIKCKGRTSRYLLSNTCTPLHTAHCTPQTYLLLTEKSVVACTDLQGSTFYVCRFRYILYYRGLTSYATASKQTTLLREKQEKNNNTN